MADDPQKTRELAELAFASSFKRKRTPRPVESSLSGSLEKLVKAFNDSSQVDEDGIEFWTARRLAVLLGYSDYRNFIAIMAKAKEACANSGQPVENHFVDVTDMVEIGSEAKREVQDIQLTRYAAYLIAQNGDPRKQQIAFAQTYFAIQSRRQEIQDEEEHHFAPLSEDHKRILLRDEIKTHNKNLASAAKGAGVESPLDFAIFQNFGYKGLYGGLDKTGIQRKKGLKSRENPLDHMGSTELAANLFRATQAEEKLRRDKTRGKDRANQLHYDVGNRVRQTIRELGGTMPENLAPAENIEKVAKRLKNATSDHLAKSAQDQDVE